MDTLKKFNVGDTVSWCSHAQGSWKEKTGKVARIVLAGNRPLIEVFPSLKYCGSPRDHESYIVMVGNKFYWPRVSKLQAVPHA